MERGFDSHLGYIERSPAIDGRPHHLHFSCDTVCECLRPVHPPLDIHRQEGPPYRRIKPDDVLVLAAEFTGRIMLHIKSCGHKCSPADLLLSVQLQLAALPLSCQVTVNKSCPNLCGICCCQHQIRVFICALSAASGVSIMQHWLFKRGGGQMQGLFLEGCPISGMQPAASCAWYEHSRMPSLLRLASKA